MNNLILIALREEAPALAQHSSVFYTGVGKVNAALSAARLIERFQPRRVWNFGTAGGITVQSGLHRCTRFVQRDMSVTALGFNRGQTPFEPELVLTTGSGGLTCSSGDSFVTSGEDPLGADVVEMEAYAIAKACIAAGVEFQCFKFISDLADSNSAQDWTSQIQRGESAYLEVLRENALL